MKLLKNIFKWIDKQISPRCPGCDMVVPSRFYENKGKGSLCYFCVGDRDKLYEEVGWKQ